MAFGKKKEEKPKAPTFYLKPSEDGKGYVGKVGDEDARVKLTPTGKAVIETMGQEFWGNPKTGQFGPYHLFVIDGHFWFGEAKDTKYGPSYKLKQGGKAEDSETWKAKQTANTPPFDITGGGVGPAGLQAPEGMPAGVVEQPTPSLQPAARPPKPSNYKRYGG